MMFPAVCFQFLCLAAGAAWGQEASTQAPEAQVQWSADATDPEFNLELPLTLGGVGEGSQVTVRFDEQENGDRLELRVTRAEFALWRVVGADAALVSGPVALSLPENAAVKLTLRRRMDRVSVLVGSGCVATLWKGVSPGKVSLSATKGVLEPDQIYYQPYAAPEFFDDFMRGQGDSTGDWEVLEGNWENTALIESVEFAPRAANSFAFAAHPQPRAVAVTGPLFWDDMSCSVAVRLPEAGQAGLGFRVQDAANYYALVLQVVSENGGSARLMLVKVVEGREQTLVATTRNIPAGQWHRLAVAVHEDRFEAFFDDIPVGAACDDAFGQGRVALLAADCATAYFDDATVQAYKGFYEDFEGGDPGRWQTVRGQWRIAAADGNKQMVPASKGPTIAVVGHAEWADYQLEADVLVGKGAAGLCFYWSSPTDYFLWRAMRGRHQLLRVSESGEEVLDAAPLAGGHRGRLRVVVRAGSDYATASVNGGQPLEALLPAGRSGAVGLFADGPSDAAFDNVRVSFPPGYVPPVLPETMLTDAEMKEQFANPAEAWFSITDDTHQPQAVGMNWNKGEYFDPVDMIFPVSLAGASAGRISVRLEGDQTTGQGGYELVIARAENSTSLVFSLSRLGELLGQASYEVGEGGTCRVGFGKRGTFVVVYVDGQLLISHRDRLSGTASASERPQPAARSTSPG